MTRVKKDFKVVENFKWLVLISLAVFVVAGIFMGARERFLNIGVDYKGGATLSVELTDALEGKSKKDFADDVTDFITKEGFKTVDKMQEDTAGEGRTYIFTLAYNYKGEEVDAKNKEQQENFQKHLTGGEEGADTGLIISLKNYILEDSPLSEEIKDKVDEASEFVKYNFKGSQATGTLMRWTVIAIIVAIIVMLIYIIFRFTLSSGLAAVIALSHDVLFMVAFTSIFNIPVNSTFIAAVITIIGYSINATIIIFDKIRECRKSSAFAYSTDTEIADYAVKQSFVKIMLSTITTLVMVVALVIFSVSTIREFIYPIIFGLIGGTFSSLCLSPAIWVYLRKPGLKLKSKKAKRA